MRGWAFRLAAWNFCSQKSSPPSLAWAIHLTSPTFFCGIWLATSQNNVETMKAPQNRSFYEKMKCLPPLAHLYRWEGEEVGLWAKHMGLKQGAIGNTHEEHIGNLMGSCWEQKEKGKKSSSSRHPPPPPKNLKEKKQGTLSTILFCFAIMCTDDMIWSLDSVKVFKGLNVLVRLPL